MRISAQLIDASSDKHLWSKRWDKSLDDVFEVQDEVSASIAAMVSPAVKGQEQVKLSSRKKVDTTAWDYYLRALAIYNSDNGSAAFTDSDKVIEMCEKSISMQSDLSDPYVLACKAIMNNIYNLDKKTHRPQNEEKYHKYCQKAYDLDNNNPEAVVALSRSYNLKRDYEKRLELAEKALELNPHHSGALFEMKRPDFEVDTEDAGASMVIRGVHPDFKITVPQTKDNKSGQIKIDQIRELLPFMMHKPARGGWRIAIIDSMDDVKSAGLARDIVKNIEDKLAYPGQIKVVVIREKRSVEYAR